MSDWYRGIIGLDALRARVGEEIGVSRWFEVDQARIEAFAAVTEDTLFIHTDPERAARETPYGGTIAHGFLTLSLLSAMAYDALPRVEGAPRGVNYGFDRVRFVAPVPAGKRVRGRFRLLGVEAGAPGEITLRKAVTVEIEGAEKPALVAEWITRQYFETERS